MPWHVRFQQHSQMQRLMGGHATACPYTNTISSTDSHVQLNDVGACPYEGFLRNWSAFADAHQRAEAGQQFQPQQHIVEVAEAAQYPTDP